MSKINHTLNRKILLSKIRTLKDDGLIKSNTNRRYPDISLTLYGELHLKEVEEKLKNVRA